MNAIVKADVAGAALVPGTLSDAMRLAEFMARAHTLPRHLQDNPGDCLMVIEQAMRWQMSPFAVAQATSVISGKLMYEGKLVAAAVETSGAITGHLDYTFTGEDDERTITVSATRRGETEPRSVTVKLRDARTDNRMWKIQPDQQLVYHGARVWARRWTPAVMLGVYSREEWGRVIDIEPAPEPAPELASKKLSKAEARAQSEAHAKTIVAGPDDAREAINEEIPLGTTAKVEPPPKRRTIAQWLDNLELQLLTAQSQEDIDLILAGREVQEAQTKLRNGALERFHEIVRNALDRFVATNGEITPDERMGA